MLFSFSRAQTFDTTSVNGWKYWKHTGIVDAVYSIIVNDTAQEGAKSQLFGFKTRSIRAEIFWRKNFVREYVTPTQFRIYIRFRTLEAPPYQTAGFELYIDSTGILEKILDGVGGPSKLYYCIDFTFSRDQYPNAPQVFTTLVLKTFMGLNTGHVEIMLDNLALEYYSPNLFLPDSVIIIDRFGDGLVSVEGENNLPSDFALSQNFPNPFNGETVISFQLPLSSFASLKVYNTLGQEVATLVDGVYEAGGHQVEWKPKNL